MDRDAAEIELQKKLNPDFVKEPPPGKYGQYVEAHHVISEANRIFGHFGWSYSLDGLQLTNDTRAGDKHHVGYSARVSVTAFGVTRGDVGHGQGHGKSEGDAHDSAVKEAVTDALKRALRTFGNPFGLALYDKTKANVGVEFNSAEMRDRLLSAINSLDDLQTLDKFWNQSKTKSVFADLDDPHKAELQKAYSDRAAMVCQAPGAE